MAEQIKDYYIVKDFTSAGAGTSTWCIAAKNGHQYFMKQFLTPVLVSQESKDKLPAPMVEAMQKACVKFVAQKRNLYAVLNGIQTGVLVVPFDLLVYNGHYLAVSELIESELSGKDISGLSEWNRLMLMRTMVMTMKALANNQIVHSDIKLDNLLIEKSEQGNYRLKLIDFDSAFFEMDPPCDPNELHGDMVYFAPEAMVLQSSEGDCDIRLNYRMDQFSVGLVLHQMWCGNLPVFDTNEYANCAEALLCDASIQLSGSLPEPVRQVVDGFLRLDPEERMDYDTAYELLGAAMAKYPKHDVTPAKPEREHAGFSVYLLVRIMVMVLSATTAFIGACPFLKIGFSLDMLSDAGRIGCYVLIAISAIAFLTGLFIKRES